MRLDQQRGGQSGSDKASVGQATPEGVSWCSMSVQVVYRPNVVKVFFCHANFDAIRANGSTTMLLANDRLFMAGKGNIRQNTMLK